MHHSNDTKTHFSITLVKDEGALPIHQQIVNGVRHAISSGRLKAGDRLPPMRQLANELGIAMNTVARAYRALDGEGLTDNQAGRGTYVRQLGVPQEQQHWANEVTIVQILRPAVTALTAMGLSRTDISNALEKLLGETPMRLGVVGSSDRGAEKWARLLRDKLSGLWVETVPVSVSELENDHPAAAVKLEGVTFVFTLLASYHKAREMLDGANKQVVPLITQLSHDSQQELLNLPRNVAVGIVCEDIYVNSILELVGSHAPTARAERVGLDDREGIARLIDTTDVILYSFAAGEVIDHFPAGKARLFPLVYTLSEENFTHIRTLVEAHAPHRHTISAPGLSRVAGEKP